MQISYQSRNNDSYFVNMQYKNRLRHLSNITGSVSQYWCKAKPWLFWSITWRHTWSQRRTWLVDAVSGPKFTSVIGRAHLG